MLNTTSKFRPICFTALAGFLAVYTGSGIADVPVDVQAVFVNNGCLACHGNSGGLSLVDAATAEAQLVNVTANCDINAQRVVPGEPENSVLWLKISSDNPACGGRMPPGGPLISQTDRDVIFNWILSLGPAAQFGLIQFQNGVITAAEEDPEVSLTVTREMGSQGQVSVDFAVATLAGDTAMSPDDYIAASGTLFFADAEASQSITVDLVDDDIFEGSETFSVTLSNVVNGAVLGSGTLAKITLLDDEMGEEPGSFFFSATGYAGAEDSASLAVTIIRAFGAAGEVSLDYQTEDLSATAGADYTSQMGTLTFVEGVKSQVISIAIRDDVDEEGDETFRILLANPRQGSSLGGAASVTVTILDNDAPEGGSGSGGGDGSGDGDTGGGTEPPGEPVTEEFTAAGVLSWPLTLLLLSLATFLRRRF